MASSFEIYLIDNEFFLDHSLKELNYESDTPGPEGAIFDWKRTNNKSMENIKGLSENDIAKEKRGVLMDNFPNVTSSWEDCVNLFNNLRPKDEKKLGSYLRKLTFRFITATNDYDSQFGINGYLLNSEIKDFYKLLRKLDLSKLEKKLISNWQKKSLSKTSYMWKGKKSKKPSLEQINSIKGWTKVSVNSFMIVIKGLKNMTPFAIKTNKAIVLRLVH